MEQHTKSQNKPKYNKHGTLYNESGTSNHCGKDVILINGAQSTG